VTLQSSDFTLICSFLHYTEREFVYPTIANARLWCISSCIYF